LDIRSLIDGRRMSGAQWRLVALCFLIVAVDGMDVAIMGFLAPSINAEWGLTPAAFGVVMGAAPIGLALGALVAGSSSDWFGRRRVLLGSLLVFGSFTLLTAFAPGPSAMALLRFLTGLGLGAAMPNTSTLVSEYVPRHSRSAIVATMFTGFNLGSAGIGFIAAALIPHFGWRSVLELGAILPLGLFVVLCFLLPESAQLLTVKGAPAERIASLLGGVLQIDLSGVRQFEVRESVPVTRRPLAALFSRNYALRTVTLWITYFMGLLVIYLSTSWLPLMMRNAGMSIAEAAKVTAWFQFGGAIGSVLLGVAMDRMHAHRAIAASYLVGSLALLTLSAAGATSSWVALLVGAVGFFLSGSQTGLNAYAPGCYPTFARATGASWMLGIGRLGSILGSSIGGALLAQGWGFGTIFAALAIPSAVAGMCMLPTFRLPRVVATRRVCPD
jgi:AAHS family 4-hydroxybenzoate transporter-like MFS transporter